MESKLAKQMVAHAIETRKEIFPERMYTHEERVAIDKVCNDFAKYKLKDLRHIMYRIILQNAKSNTLKPTDEDYLLYLASL